MKVSDIVVNYEDDRGKIMDLIDGDIISAVTYITCNKGSIRANHYHKKTSQYNYIISGKMKVVTQMPDEEIKTVIIEKGGMFEIGPHERHAFQAVEDSELMVFTRGPRGGKDYESDTFRLDEPLI